MYLIHLPVVRACIHLALAVAVPAELNVVSHGTVSPRHFHRIAYHSGITSFEYRWVLGISEARSVLRYRPSLLLRNV